MQFAEKRNREKIIKIELLQKMKTRTQTKKHELKNEILRNNINWIHYGLSLSMSSDMGYIYVDLVHDMTM